MGNNFESLGCGALSGLIRGSTDSHHRRMESERNPYQQWRMDMLPHRCNSRFVIRVCFVSNVGEEAMSVSRPLSDEGCAYGVVTARDGGVILDVEHDRLLKLNPTAAEIWALAKAGEPESQIVLKIAELYRVSRERVADDFRDLLTNMQELGSGM